MYPKWWSLVAERPQKTHSWVWPCGFGLWFSFCPWLRGKLALHVSHYKHNLWTACFPCQTPISLSHWSPAAISLPNTQKSNSTKPRAGRVWRNRNSIAEGVQAPLIVPQWLVGSTKHPKSQFWSYSWLWHTSTWREQWTHYLLLREIWGGDKLWKRAANSNLEIRSRLIGHG